MHAVAVALDIAISAILGVVLIVVNERFKHGLPEGPLALQAVFWIAGILLLTNNSETVGLIILHTSVIVGITGFVILLQTPGPARFTECIFLPGKER